MREEQTPLFRRRESITVEYNDERERQGKRERRPKKRMREK